MWWLPICHSGREGGSGRSISSYYFCFPFTSADRTWEVTTSYIESQVLGLSFISNTIALFVTLPWRQGKSFPELDMTSTDIDPHYSDVILSAMASQITGVSIVYSAISSGPNQRKQKLRVTGLCAGNSPVTGEFPVQRTNYTQIVSIWRHHHALHSLNSNVYRSVMAVQGGGGGGLWKSLGLLMFPTNDITSYKAD